MNEHASAAITAALITAAATLFVDVLRRFFRAKPSLVIISGIAGVMVVLAVLLSPAGSLFSLQIASTKAPRTGPNMSPGIEQPIASRAPAVALMAPPWAADAAGSANAPTADVSAGKPIGEPRAATTSIGDPTTMPKDRVLRPNEVFKCPACGWMYPLPSRHVGRTCDHCKRQNLDLVPMTGFNGFYYYMVCAACNRPSLIPCMPENRGKTVKVACPLCNAPKAIRIP